MSAGVDMRDDAGMDVQQAGVILRQAGERARRELAVKRPLLLATWGLVTLAGYGVTWLSVRGQRPIHGPAVWAIVTVVALLLIAVVLTAWVVDRASSGVGGLSVRQRGSFALALAVGVVALEIFIRAVSHAGADRAVVLLLGVAAPLLVTGVVLLASCAVHGSLDVPRLSLGLWLLAVASEGAWAGPVTYLWVCALVGGGGILLMAALEPALRRS